MCVVDTALGTANLGRNGGPRPYLIYLLLTVLCATHNCWCSAARSVGTGCRTAVVADLLQLGGVSSSTPDERHDAPSCTARAWSLLFALRDVHKLCETFTSSAQQVCASCSDDGERTTAQRGAGRRFAPGWAVAPFEH